MASKDGEHSRIERLNGRNYQMWKLRIRALLMRDDLWGNVVDSRPEGDPLVEWIRKDRKAIAAIQLNVDDEQLLQIGELETAKEMWDALHRLHERASIGSRLYLLRRLHSLRFQNGTMASHLNTMREIAGHLRGIGKPIEDTDFVAAMLCSLPESYSPLVTALEARDEDTLTIEYVSGKLLDEYDRRLQQKPSTAPKTETAMQASSKETKRNKKVGVGKNDQNKNLTFREMRSCYKCGKVGHLKHNCPDLRGQLPRDRLSSARATREDFFTFRLTDDRVRAVDTCKPKLKDWCIDSGATRHITPDRDFFDKLQTTETSRVYLANGSCINASGVGDGYLQCQLEDGRLQRVWLRDVLYVPEMEGGLLSVQRMTAAGYQVRFVGEKCFVSSYKNAPVAYARLHGSLFLLQGEHSEEQVCAVQTKDCIHRWHRRLGHRDPTAIYKLASENMVTGLQLSRCGDRMVCGSCLRGKLTQKPFVPSQTRSLRIFELVHTDVMGPMQTETPSGGRFVMTFIDDYSRFTMIRILKAKSEVAEATKDFVNMVKRQYDTPVKTIRSDNGREYIDKTLTSFLRREGIIHQFTIPYTPQQNGIAERKNRSLIEMAKCMLDDAQLNKRFWGEAIATAAYLQNRLPSRSLGKKTPYEMLSDSKPDLSHLRIFGSKVYSLVPKTQRRKLDNNSVEACWAHNLLEYLIK